MLHRLFLLMLTALVLPASVLAEDPPPALEAMAMPTDMRLAFDGRLDEAFWQQVAGSDAFVQQEPREGDGPTERTEVRVVYDKNHLYIGVVLYDSEPDGILSFQRRRDASLATDDRFMWILDTYNDGRSAYFFEINPGGLMGDGLLTSGQGISLNKDWDGIWEARVARGAYGWSAEIRIPFRTLNFDTEQDTWGINFHRTIRRKNEELVWSGFRRNQGLFRPQNAGQLTGLRGLSQGLGLEVKPYAIGEANRVWTDGDLDTDPVGDAGFDVTYSVTTNLRASLTVNTDFAETEVDQRRVNLTRFPLRFPEQRDFFLEGSSVFRFAPSSGVDPYFSRRIGLQRGRPIPIRAGARLAGQVGRFDVGFLQIRTGELGDVQAEDFTVARAKAHILSESTLGFIYTRRSTQDGKDVGLQDRHTIGVDLELGTSTFQGSKNLQFQAFFIAHNAALINDDTRFFDRTTRGIRFSYPNQPFFMHASYREFGSAYDPAVGFNRRNGFRRFQPSLGYSWLLSDHPVLREFTLGLRHEYLMDLDFKAETVNISITPELRFESGDQIELLVGHDFERLREDFDIRRDSTIIIPADSYHTFEVGLEGQTAPQRRVSVGAEAGYGGFWTGTRTDVEVDATIRPMAGISVSAAWEHTDVNLDEGSFRTNLVRVATSLALTPWTSFSANVQYDDLSRIVGLYGRFRWVIRPGSDLYLVYTHNWLDDPMDRFRSLTSQAATKLTYTHRF